MRTLTEIVKDREALINSRVADFEHRIAIALLRGKFAEAHRLEQKKQDYLRTARRSA